MRNDDTKFEIVSELVEQMPKYGSWKMRIYVENEQWINVVHNVFLTK